MIISITSDCGAVSNVYNTHNYTHTPSATCAVTLDAGMDIECGVFLQSHLDDAINDKNVSMATVDAALVNLFTVQLRLGEH